MLKFSFELVLEFTLEPPLRLDDGLFSFSAFCPCLDSDFDLDLDFESDLDGLLHPHVDLDPDLLKLRLAVLAISIATLHSNPTSGTSTCSRCCML